MAWQEIVYFLDGHRQNNFIYHLLSQIKMMNKLSFNRSSG